jgi:hypothetical protein
MSNYIHVLKRLESERRAPSETRTQGATTTVAGAAPALVTAPAATPVPTDESVAEPASAAVAPATHPAVALRAMPSTQSRPSERGAAGTPALDGERTTEPAADAADAPAARRDIDWTPPHRPLDPRRALSDAALKGIAGLLDNIRVLSAGHTTRTVVFAGASKSEPVGLVTAGLAAHAERQGMAVFTAELTKSDGRSFLVPRPSPGAAARFGAADALEIDLDGGAAPSDLNAWVERVAPDAQLVIVAGPPLANSIDTALLACASDGLVIVAESEVTDRNALQLAAERARIAGCRTLGVVMHGTQERMPAWMRRLMGNPTTNDAPRED